MKSTNRLFALLLALVMAMSFATMPVLAAEEEEIPTGNQTEASWVYEVAAGGGMGGPGGPGGPGGGGGGMPPMNEEEIANDPFMAMMMEAMKPKATILWGTGEEKSGNVVMIPAQVGGYPVTTVGNGVQNISSNNKNEDVYFLIADGITTLSPRMIYDYNSTSGWSIPSSVTSIDARSFLSCPGTFYGEAGSAAETYTTTDATRGFVTYSADGSTTFTAQSTEEGYIQPNGTYHLPSGMLDGKHEVTFHIVADYQYKIQSLTVDGAEVTEAAGKNEYDLKYTFTTASALVDVVFEADPEDSRDPAEMTETFEYDAPELEEKAVAEGVEVPESVFEYVGVNTGSTAKYLNSMGISTGQYYAADGKFYEMVKAYQETEEPEYMSGVEAINGVYKKDKLVYGQDYDLIRVYNYYENVTNGPARGIVSLYCTYLYKEITLEDIAEESRVSNDNTNTASIFVQKGGEVELVDFVSYCYTASKGPSEAGNFFGLGSAVHVDGGDATTPATNLLNKATSALTMRNPQILGTVNSIYATGSGVIYIEGGNIFSCSSGGHGPYVSTGGQIYMNIEGTNILAEDGSINRDAATLEATERPDANLGTMTRNAEGAMEGVYEEHADNVSVVVTGDEAGTALATDSGGGVIVANNVVTKTFGLRCAGVYSIGSNESWVYCYNSTLTSYLDAGLCSATGGYIYAFNCDINGVMGIKTRAGGNTEAEETGVYVTNSRVAASFDAEEMKNAYDVADPETMSAKMASGEIDVNNITTGYGELNIFLDKANSPKFYEDSLDWWFTDKSKTPGYSGGNKFAVIYVENSSTPVYVESSLMINQNYKDYGDPAKLEAGQIPADNLILSVEGAGSATVHFKNNNAETPWDLTGKDTATTEISGDMFIGAYSQASGSPDKGTGPNTANLFFENSDWEGTVLYGDTEEITGVANLSFDHKSTWKVTADTYVSNLEIYNVEGITADEPVTVYFASSSTVVPGIYGNVTLYGNGVEEWPEIPEEEPAQEEAPVVEESAVEEAPVEETPAEPAPEAAPEETPVEPMVEETVEEPTEESSNTGIIAVVVIVVIIAAAVIVVLKKKKK